MHTSTKTNVHADCKVNAGKRQNEKMGRIVVPAAYFQNFVAAQPVFQSIQLNRIRGEHYAGNYVFHIIFQPTQLKFIDTKYATIKFNAYVELQEPLHLEKLASAAAPLTTVRNEISNSSPVKNMAFIATVPNWTGYFEIEIQCEYGHETDDALKRADVFVRLGTASLNYDVEPGDMKVLFDKFVVPQQANINQVFLNKSETNICPTISLGGINPANITFDEVTNFDVEVFPIGTAPKQVLAIAFNLKQGCHGIDDFVSNFIAENDYGIISDEYLVERILKYRWRLGGFRRSLSLSQSFQGMDSNKNPVNGTLYGYLSLNSLDIVSIECDSNSRTDYIRIGGSSTAYATSITLDDGSDVDPKNIELGDPAYTPWNLFTSVELDQEFSPDNEIKLFQIQAHDDAYQFLGKPFANFPVAAPPTLIYTRTEGISKQVLFIGNIATIFE